MIIKDYHGIENKNYNNNIMEGGAKMVTEGIFDEFRGRCGELLEMRKEIHEKNSC